MLVRPTKSDRRYRNPIRSLTHRKKLTDCSLRGTLSSEPILRSLWRYYLHRTSSPEFPSCPPVQLFPRREMTCPHMLGLPKQSYLPPDLLRKGQVSSNQATPQLQPAQFP